LVTAAPVGLTDIHPVPWERVRAASGNEVDVEFTLRSDICEQLARVTAEENPDSVVLTVHLGRPGDGAAPRECGSGPEIRRARIGLREPLGRRQLLDPARGATTAEPTHAD
jgi:hypothetical protein